MSSESKNIFFIGFRGTGKSTIARILAKKMNCKVLSTDKIVEKSEGEKIAAIVKNKGWKYFRDAECIALQDSIEHNNIIIDCGGGIVLREKNRKLLKRNKSLIVLLEATTDTIEQRITHDQNRTRFTPDKSLREEIEAELEKRNKFYHSLAHLKFNTTTEQPESIVDKIISQLGK